MIEEVGKGLNGMSTMEAIARLRGLRKNTPTGDIEERLVDEFNDILRQLQNSTGVDLKNFIVPNHDVKSRIATYNMETRQETYTSEKYCNGSLFLAKLDGAMELFEMLLAKEDGKIGFKS